MALVMTRRHLGRQLASIVAIAGAGGIATAAIAGETIDLPSLPQPAGKPILTISGRIAVANQGNTARFDRAMLEALGTSGFETTTPWYDSPVRFEGVRMSHLMDVVGASGDRVMAYALNDYSTELPMVDFARYNVLLALKRNGEYMTVRDKGPIFIVYPFDSDPELRHQRFYTRSAWQVASLVVR